MKLVITSMKNGSLTHEEVELPERFLDIQVELASGPIFQFSAKDDEQVLELREVTFRHLALFPNAANSLTIKGL
jgi:hypothetical protein